MSKAVKPRRGYDASRRQAQARETVRAILHAAHTLFVEQGYARTTMADVATAAGVSVETVYSAVGTKPTLLHRTWDVTIGGDDEVIAYHERPEVRQLLAEGDLARRFEMQARLFTETARRVVPLQLALVAAAGADHEAAAMLEEIGRQRLVGIGVMAHAAAVTGQLAVSETQCRDVVWATTDGQLWQRLVAERGWSDDAFATWLGQLWVSVLVRGR